MSLGVDWVKKSSSRVNSSQSLSSWPWVELKQLDWIGSPVWWHKTLSYWYRGSHVLDTRYIIHSICKMKCKYIGTQFKTAEYCLLAAQNTKTAE